MVVVLEQVTVRLQNSDHCYTRNLTHNTSDAFRKSDMLSTEITRNSSIIISQLMLGITSQKAVSA